LGYVPPLWSTAYPHRTRPASWDGRALVDVYRHDGWLPDGEFAQSAVSVTCDGIARQVDPGDIVILGPGESITLPPYLYHTFYAVDGHGHVGEISSVNDDDTDNYLREPLPRYPQTMEDEPSFRLLCTEYGAVR
jgi:D-lyxose ketol-isomerase